MKDEIYILYLYRLRDEDMVKLYKTRRDNFYQIECESSFLPRPEIFVSYTAVVCPKDAALEEVDDIYLQCQQDKPAREVRGKYGDENRTVISI